MDKWSAHLTVILLLLACLTVQARNVFIYGHGDVPLGRWFSLKHVEADGHPEQEGTRLWGGPKQFPGLSFERNPFPGLRFEEAPVSCPLHGVPKSFICNTCLNISMQAQQILSDPDNLEHIIEYVNSSLCEPLMPGIHTECIGLAETYIPEAFKMLQEYFTPDTLCVDTKICLGISMLLLENNIKCSICEGLAIVALGYLNNNKTQTKILAALHSVCSKLGRFSIKCYYLVDLFALTLFEEFQSLTPQQLCQDIRLCSAVSTEKKSHCTTCEYVIFEIKAILKVPAMQKKLMEVLLNGCTKIPNHAEKCKEIVTRYGPFILANMDLFLDADTLCTKIHVCEAVPASNITPAVREGKMQ